MQARRIVIQWQREHGGFADAVEAEQQPRDLCGLDTVAAHFDLIVGTTDELQRLLAIAPDPVAAAVDPCARCAERVGQEAFGGQRRLVQVAKGNAVATDVQLTGNLIGHRVEHIVEHIDMGTGQRCADWNTARQRGELFDLVGEHAHGSFARPVVVDQTTARFELA